MSYVTRTINAENGSNVIIQLSSTINSHRQNSSAVATQSWNSYLNLLFSKSRILVQPYI